MNKLVTIICGATASGKSKYALQFAQYCNGTIINADSAQVYRGLEILTAQPSRQDLACVEHLCYGHISCDQSYSVAQWLQEVHAAIAASDAPIVVGGTGMYINALVRGLSKVPVIEPDVRHYWQQQLQELGVAELHKTLTGCDPKLAARLSFNDTYRVLRGLEVFTQTKIPLSDWQIATTTLPNLRFKIIWLNPSRRNIYDNCNSRFLQMLEQGALQEVQNLIDANLKYLPKAIGLHPLKSHLAGELSLAEATCIAQQATRNYAKRQLTWFRNQLPKLGVKIEERLA